MEVHGYSLFLKSFTIAASFPEFTFSNLHYMNIFFAVNVLHIRNSVKETVLYKAVFSTIYRTSFFSVSIKLVNLISPV